MPKISENILSHEECFLKLYELGTAQKVSAYFERQGKISPLTGKPFSYNTIYVSAMIYIMDNPENARKYFAERNVIFSDEDWDRWLIQKALRYRCSSKRMYLKWLKDHGYWGVEKYKDIYAIRMGML